MKLSHEQTLEWIRQHKAWRLARKNKPIWARAVEADEVGQEYQTADLAKQQARAGFWLCVGVAGEPWFQKLERIEARYERGEEVTKQFAFDQQPHRYLVFKPRLTVQNWAAQVVGPDLEGFYIRPNYDPNSPLYSPAGGYVVKDYDERTPDPYQGQADDVWLVQQGLFDSTYEFVAPEAAP